jgi:hypothetical protein
VIILVIQYVCVAIPKLKREAPVSAYGNGPKTFSVAFKRMQSKPWDIHILDRGRRIQGDQYLPPVEFETILQDEGRKQELGQVTLKLAD